MPSPPEQHHQIWPYVWMLLGSLCIGLHKLNHIDVRAIVVHWIMLRRR